MGERTGLLSHAGFVGEVKVSMHHGKIGRLLAGLGVCDKSETSVLQELLAGKAGSMRPRKCASGDFPWWLRQYP